MRAPINMEPTPNTAELTIHCGVCVQCFVTDSFRLKTKIFKHTPDTLPFRLSSSVFLIAFYARFPASQIGSAPDARREKIACLKRTKLGAAAARAICTRGPRPPPPAGSTRVNHHDRERRGLASRSASAPPYTAAPIPCTHLVSAFENGRKRGRGLLYLSGCFTSRLK